MGMALWIEISPGSHEPIYAQIVTQIGRAVARGDISAGDKLPAVRRLAAELVINPNTVARAYTALERQKLVVCKTGAGTFVADPALSDRDASQLNVLTERMDTVIARAKNLGLTLKEIAGMFEKRLRGFARDAQRGPDHG